MESGLSQVPAQCDCSVIEMGLCEVEHIMLRPNQLYRFVVMPDCEKCKALDVYSPNAPAHGRGIPRKQLQYANGKLSEAMRKMDELRTMLCKPNARGQTPSEAR